MGVGLELAGSQPSVELVDVGEELGVGQDASQVVVVRVGGTAGQRVILRGHGAAPRLSSCYYY